MEIKYAFSKYKIVPIDLKEEIEEYDDCTIVTTTVTAVIKRPFLFYAFDKIQLIFTKRETIYNYSEHRECSYLIPKIKIRDLEIDKLAFVDIAVTIKDLTKKYDQITEELIKEISEKKK